MKKTRDEYDAKAPTPVNTQFPDRRGKKEAVQAFKVTPNLHRATFTEIIFLRSYES